MFVFPAVRFLREPVFRGMPLAAVLTLVFALISAVPGHAAEPGSFQYDPAIAAAQRYEAWLKGAYKPDGKPASEHKRAGEAALSAGGDARIAAQHFARAAATDLSDGQSWLGLARALLAVPQEQLSGSERYETPEHASGAAYLAYERAATADTKAAALAALSDALQRQSQWRPAIDALKVSLSLKNDPAVETAYEQLRSQHGFRVLDYRVDNESASPRVCVQFSETLAKSQDNIAGYVSVNGSDAEDVQREGSELCIGGLKHGERYAVRVRSGIAAEIGETLPKTAELSIYVRDRSARVRFTGRNYVLPRNGQAGIPVSSINTDKVQFEIFRIGDRSLVNSVTSGDLMRQLDEWEAQRLSTETGERIFKGSLGVRRERNEEVTTAIPVSSVIPELKPGVYVISATPDDIKSEAPATQWFVVSDLGLTAITGDDGVHAFVRSLATAAPLNGVNVELVARNNEVLASSTTDADGHVRFDGGVAKGEGGLAPALLVARAADGDYGFLNLTEAAFDLTDRGVSGRVPAGAIDGYLYTDRGIYRPGETIHTSALVRNRDGSAATLPTNLIVRRPDGVIDRRIALADQGAGGRTQPIGLSTGAMTGTWRLALHLDPKDDPIAEASVMVEDFVPERLSLDLKPVTDKLTIGTNGRVGLTGRYLYGPPAADLAIEGDVVVRPSEAGDSGHPGYVFGAAEEVLPPVRETIETDLRTDANGLAELEFSLPQVPRTAKPLEAQITVRLREAGGRTIERNLTLPVDVAAERIGVRPRFEDGAVEEGQSAGFDVIALDSNGQLQDRKGLAWRVVRLEQIWQWYKDNGRWSYDAATVTRTVASGSIDASSSGPVQVDVPVTWGRYRFEVEAPGAADAPLLSSVAFNSGWAALEDAESPEVLEVALDKPTHAAGETARIRVSTKLGGRAIVAILGKSLLMQKSVDVPAADSEIPIEVSQDWGAGAYATVILHRPMEIDAKRMPTRAIGMAWVAVDQAARTVGVEIGGPEKTRSGQAVSVPVQIKGLANGEQAYLTLAAVDVGILNLTRFGTPDPGKWFNAQTRLGAEIRDLYGRLIDGMRAEAGSIRSGGDADPGIDTSGPPPAHETVALFSGIIQADKDGSAEVTFDMPAFNGALRLMAVAWTQGRTGHAARDMIVRDPVAVTTSLPRFLTLGDSARITVDMHNVEGAAGAYEVAVQSAGDGQAVRTIASDKVVLKDGERRAIGLDLAPDKTGPATLTIAINGPNGVSVVRERTIEVHPPGRDTKLTTVHKFAPGARLTVDGSRIRSLVADDARVMVNVGPMAAFDVPGLLNSLDRYPYGCTEQTISRALPLLSANDLAKRIGLASDEALKERIEGAISRVLAMQDSSGAFGVWGPYTTDLWLTGYAVDFLSRAREAGYPVDSQRFEQAIDRLANFVAYTQDVTDDGSAMAYALYGLARNGRVPAGELRYYADAKLDAFKSSIAKAQIGAALALIGDRERAERVFATAAASASLDADAISRADFGSNLRDAAAVLALASEARVQSVDRMALAEKVSNAYVSRPYSSTQEQAWLVLAAKAMSDVGPDLQLAVDGAAHTGTLETSLAGSDLLQKAVLIENTGSVETAAVVTALGPSAAALPPVNDAGIAVSRNYYTLDGRKVDLASANGGQSTVAQNERFVVVLSVSATQRSGRLLLEDRLPAGFEIENPRIVASGSVSGFDWLKVAVEPEHTEFRDDRFAAAFNLFGNGSELEAGNTFRVAYIVRAVTPGSFVHPAASVEDMYRPDRHGRTATGRLTITPQN